MSGEFIDALGERFRQKLLEARDEQDRELLEAGADNRLVVLAREVHDAGIRPPDGLTKHPDCIVMWWAAPEGSPRHLHTSYGIKWTGPGSVAWEELEDHCLRWPE